MSVAIQSSVDAAINISVVYAIDIDRSISNIINDAININQSIESTNVRIVIITVMTNDSYVFTIPDIDLCQRQTMLVEQKPM